MRSVSASSCRGGCELLIDPLESDQWAIIAGFDYRRQDGDGHIKRIAMMPTRYSGRASFYANFFDDDFLFDVTLQYVIFPADPDYVRWESRYLYDRDGAQYDRNRERDPDFVHPRLNIYTETPLAALNGFSFEFQNGGHFIEDIGVEPFDSSLEVWFQDNQSDQDRRFPDDPFDWYLDFTRFR